MAYTDLKPIPDHLREGLRLLFVGFNPSIGSAETGHHYANPNNRFWRIIHEAVYRTPLHG